MIARTIGPLIASVLLALTAACIPETQTFLSDRAASAPDQRLAGTWYALKDHNLLVFHFAPAAKPGGTMTVTWVESNFNSGKNEKGSRYLVWPTRIGQRTYLNIEQTSAPGKKSPTRTIMQYTITPKGVLSAHFLDSKVVAASIKSGKLAGRFKIGKYTTTAVITASRASLIAYLKRKGDSAFAKDATVVHRLKPTQ